MERHGSIIIGDIYLGALGNKQVKNFTICGKSGIMSGECPPLVFCVDICPLFQKVLDNVFVFPADCMMKGCSSVVVRDVDIDPF